MNKNTYLSRQKRDNASTKRSSLKQEIKSEIETEDSDDENLSRNYLKQEIKSVVKADISDGDDDDESIVCGSESPKTHDNVKAKSDDDAKVKAFLKDFDVDDDEMQENTESDESSESSEGCVL